MHLIIVHLYRADCTLQCVFPAFNSTLLRPSFLFFPVFHPSEVCVPDVGGILFRGTAALFVRILPLARFTVSPSSPEFAVQTSVDTGQDRILYWTGVRSRGPASAVGRPQLRYSYCIRPSNAPSVKWALGLIPLLPTFGGTILLGFHESVSLISRICLGLRICSQQQFGASRVWH